MQSATGDLLDIAMEDTVPSAMRFGCATLKRVMSAFKAANVQC